MKNRSAEEILSFTFAHLDTIVREKRNGQDKIRDQANGRAAQRWGQEDSAVPESVAGKNIRSGRR
ncbi:MAG: hypothetical protein ACYC9M_04010 [Desulfobulbaceae bacterium]